jgi:type II secretory pathway pseudopilin PulG
MEPLTIVIGIASIVATGALSRVGESISDEIASNAMQLLCELPYTKSKIMV